MNPMVLSNSLSRKLVSFVAHLPITYHYDDHEYHHYDSLSLACHHCFVKWPSKKAKLTLEKLKFNPIIKQ